VCGVQITPDTSVQAPILQPPVRSVTLSFNVFAPNVQGTTTIDVVGVGNAQGVTCTNNPAGKCKSQKVACKKVGGSSAVEVATGQFVGTCSRLLQSTVLSAFSLGTSVGVALYL